MGDCLSYRFADGDYGAVIVLSEANHRPNPKDVLVGVLDYKQPKPPSWKVFENRNWLKDKASWRKGQNFTIWVSHCYGKDCIGIEEKAIGHIELQEYDRMNTILGTFWDELPQHVILAMQGD